MSQTLDPTFYHSPADAIAAPPERLAYVAAFDPAGAVKDAVTVIGCDPSSPDYGKVVGWSELPTVGNELHHFGWNACSSALCHQGHGGHGTPLERRYLIVPGIRSSRTWLGGPAWLVPRAVARGAAGHAGPASPGTARPPVPRVAAGVAGRRRRVQPRHHHVPRGPASAAGAPSRPAGPAPPSGARPARPQAARSPRCPGKPRHSRQALVRRSTRAAGATRQSRALRTPLGIVGARRTGRQARLARRGRQSRSATADSAECREVVAVSRSTTEFAGSRSCRVRRPRISAGTRTGRTLDNSTVSVPAAPARPFGHRASSRTVRSTGCARCAARYATSSRPCRPGSRDSIGCPSITTANRRSLRSAGEGWRQARAFQRSRSVYKRTTSSSSTSASSALAAAAPATHQSAPGRPADRYARVPGCRCCCGRRGWATSSPCAGSYSRIRPVSSPSTTASYHRQTATSEPSGAAATATR